jgi:hypothetical protein
MELRLRAAVRRRLPGSLVAAAETADLLHREIESAASESSMPGTGGDLSLNRNRTSPDLLSPFICGESEKV